MHNRPRLLDDGSRMRREVHVRFCESLGVQLPRATHLLALFERQDDADRFFRALPQRLAKFGLTLADDKTRVVPFGRQHWRPHQPRPEHFDFLGFRHHLSQDRQGRMTLVRLPSPKSQRKFLQGVKQWLQQYQHAPPRWQQEQLTQKLRGFYPESSPVLWLK